MKIEEALKRLELEKLTNRVPGAAVTDAQRNGLEAIATTRKVSISAVQRMAYDYFLSNYRKLIETDETFK